MQALINFIISNFKAIWPLFRVNEWQQAMLVRGGRIRREVSAGVHWKVPCLDEVMVWPRNEVALDLPTGSVTTVDGQSVTISANLSYRMVSIATMWRSMWNTENTLKLKAAGHITSECGALAWEKLSRDRRSVENDLLASMRRFMEGTGVEVMAVRLTDCVPSDARRHYHDGSIPR